jgi:hypothetical protein
LCADTGGLSLTVSVADWIYRRYYLSPIS